MADKNIYRRLSDVQVKLKAPKGQKNTFGGYSYRSAEDILEAVKPLLADADLTLIVTDEVVLVGDRYYVKATAMVIGTDDENTVEATAYAREAETKKGMDESQITGTASSYARKYALNGLFNIDDTKDADTDGYHKTTNQQPAPAPVPAAPTVDPLTRTKGRIKDQLADMGKNPVQMKSFITSVLGKSTIDTQAEADDVEEAIRIEKEDKGDA